MAWGATGEGEEGENFSFIGGVPCLQHTRLNSGQRVCSTNILCVGPGLMATAILSGSTQEILLVLLSDQSYDSSQDMSGVTLIYSH